MDVSSNTDDSEWKTVQSKRKSSVNMFHKKQKKKASDVPSTEELNNLREAETMFHSNLFKMQVEELLKELKANMSEKDEFIEWLEIFKGFLVEMPERSQCSIKDFDLGDLVKIPILQKPESDKGSFKFVAPQNIAEIGSFVLETLCSATPVVDIAVEIPKVCWQARDFLNNCYHRKRAFYLACIAHSLKNADIVSDVKFSYQDDCYMKPVLLIVPQGMQKISVRLTAYPSSEAFKLNRFIPSKNNVRSSWMLGTHDDGIAPPTPYYNATILADLLLPKLHEFLKESISSENLKDGIILLKLWCTQRGLTSGYGRLNGFILTIFVAYLLKQKKINHLMNAYQVFRCAVLAFRNEDFIQQGISLCDEDNSNPPIEDFREMYGGVFVDMSGFFNICYGVTKETFVMVQHEARLCLQLLDKESPDCFGPLFINKITFSRKFEYMLLLKGPKKFRKYAKELNFVKEILDYGENKVACVMPKICDILRKGLNERILLLDVVKEPTKPWPVSETPPSPNAGQVVVGFLLNPDVPINNLEKGPNAEDPKAKEFRNFWGDQSELRRFQDGTIREAVFWPAVTLEDKRNVFCTIIKDILKRHLNAVQSEIIVVGTEVDCTLHLPKIVLSPEFPAYGTGEEAHVTLMQSFNSLAKQLRSLKGLPLLISSIQGTSPAFRFSEVFPPLPALPENNSEICIVDGCITKLSENATKVPAYIPALNVILNLEGSGKWPDDVGAIKRIKTAFYIKIAELAKSQCSLIAVPFINHVDIVKDGFVFRLEIACHKEIFLMKQVRMPNGITKIKETKESQDLELTTEILPKLNSALHGLHQQHNTFGTTCRLAKRWVSAQLKHGYISDTAVELLVAYLYVHPEPYTCPCSPQVGFIRFLTLVINHDWATSPLIVNLNSELETPEIKEIQSKFTSQRSTLPPMGIVTPFDKRGNTWTKGTPSALILKRLVLLAEASLEMLEKALHTPKGVDIKAIFRPPLQSYDALIYLKRNQIPRLCCAVDIHHMDSLPCFTPFKSRVNEVYPVVEYDPVQRYLEELKVKFNKTAHFLCDLYGGDFIAVVWKKSAFDSEQKVSPEEVIEEITMLGTGILKKIELQTNRT